MVWSQSPSSLAHRTKCPNLVWVLIHSLRFWRNGAREALIFLASISAVHGSRAGAAHPRSPSRPFGERTLCACCIRCQYPVAGSCGSCAAGRDYLHHPLLLLRACGDFDFVVQALVIFCTRRCRSRFGYLHLRLDQHGYRSEVERTQSLAGEFDVRAPDRAHGNEVCFVQDDVCRLSTG